LRILLSPSAIPSLSQTALIYRSFFFNVTATTDIYTLSLHDALPIYVPHRHVYGEQWIKFMKDGVNATPLPTVNTTGYIDHEGHKIGRAVQQECRDRSRMPSSA